MSKVSDMIKMYSQQNTTTGPKPTTSVARRWPPVTTSVGTSSNKPPPLMGTKPALNGTRPNFTPKPSALHPGGHSTAPWAAQKTTNNNSSGQRKASDQEEKLPPWSARRQENNEEKPVPTWKQEQPDRNGVPSWKARQEQQKNSTPSWMNRQRPEQGKKIDSQVKPWQQNQGERNAWEKPPVLPKSIDDFPLPPSPWKNTPPPPVPETLPEPELPEDEDMYLESQSPAHYPPPININPHKKPYSAGFSFPKPALEKSSGSFKSSPALRINNDSEDKAGRRNQSFLHAPAGPKLPGPKPSSSILPNESSLPPPLPPLDRPLKVPPRLPIPPEKFSEPPPLKQSKPPNVILPIKGRKKLSIPSLLKPKSPSRNLPPPPLPENDLPPLPKRDPEPPPLPPMTRNLSISSAMDIPPSLPARRPLPSPTPDKKSMPLPVVPPLPPTAPPPDTSDDIYEDTTDTPPALPPMRQPVPPPLPETQQTEMIPTYESDEEDQAAIYDETADEIPPMASPYPPTSGYSPAGNFPPEPEDVIEETYEDVEEYMKFKRLRQLQQQQPPPTNQISAEGSKKDKKKSSSEKKEKDIRKKFKLSLEGDINPVGKGRVKENMKGGWVSSKGLSVTADELVDVIRMTDNPKGKWLARNSNGEYGYVDSDKVEINTSDLRSMMGVAHGYGVDPSGIPIQPVAEDDEVIYDQTADEDIYEEV